MLHDLFLIGIFLSGVYVAVVCYSIYIGLYRRKLRKTCGYSIEEIKNKWSSFTFPMYPECKNCQKEVFCLIRLYEKEIKNKYGILIKKLQEKRNGD